MKEEWKSGNPPHIGWWNASRCEDWNAWRWWNGEYWSSCAYPTYGMDAVIDAAHSKSVDIPSKQIKFREKYPKRAMCKRYNPLTGEVTGDSEKCQNLKPRKLI